MFGPTGLSSFVLRISSSLHKMQTGYIFHLTLIILIGAVLFFSLWEIWLICKFLVDYRFFIVIAMLSFFLLNFVKNKNYF